MRDTKMAGTPVEIKANGKSYKLSPLSLRHIAALSQWHENAVWERAEKRIALLVRSGLSDTLLEKKTDAIMAKAELELSDDVQRRKALNSVDAGIKGLRLSFAREHPKMSDEEFNGILDSFGHDALLKKMDGVNSTGEPQDQEEESGKVNGQ